MYPILYENELILIPAWHTFYLLAAFLAYGVFKNALKTSPVEYRTNASGLFFLIYFCGYFGARIFALTVEHQVMPWHAEFWQSIAQLGSMTLYGGVIAGLTASVIFCRIKNLDFSGYLDALVIAALVAIAVGRIGCFLNGDDYGIPIPDQLSSPPWWAVAFPNHPEHIFRYPTQLMETIVCLLLALAGRLKHGQLKPGALGCILASCYMIQRFFLEFLRGDDRGEIVTDLLSPAQVISLVGLLVFSLMLLRIRRQGRIHP